MMEKYATGTRMTKPPTDALTNLMGLSTLFYQDLSDHLF